MFHDIVFFQLAMHSFIWVDLHDYRTSFRGFGDYDYFNVVQGDDYDERATKKPIDSVVVAR